VWMFAAGRMVLRVFLGSHDTLVAVSAPFMMPLCDSDIPMNVPFTFSNKQPLSLSCTVRQKRNMTRPERVMFRFCQGESCFAFASLCTQFGAVYSGDTSQL
jgi:hypothetical protein